ncbi:MAG: glycosyltransferase family 1 protein [Bryobacteraceae bacterium]
MPLRIGVNALYLIPGGVGGTEIYLRRLLDSLAVIDRENRYVVFTNRETSSDLVPSAANFVYAPQPVRARSRPARILWEQTGLAIAARRHRLDVMFNPGFTAPLYPGCPNVTVFHDLQHKRHPENFRWFDLPFWRVLLHGAARRSLRIIAVSEATRADLIRYYPFAAARIAVISHGVEPRFFEIGRHRAPENFLLCVSTLHPHKNLDKLIDAFARFRAAYPDFQLVIAGLRGFFAESLERRIASLNLAAAVRLTGWIPREDLYDLYRRAFAFVYPSSFEGFGMPVLEAMAAGIPQACSNIEPLKTLAGSAALLFNPDNAEEFSAALTRIVSDDALRQRLEIEGPLRAAGFSWDETARLTLSELRRAACYYSKCHRSKSSS